MDHMHCPLITLKTKLILWGKKKRLTLQNTFLKHPKVKISPPFLPLHLRFSRKQRVSHFPQLIFMDPLLSIKQFTSSSPITHSFSTPNIFRGFFCCPVNMYRTASVSRVSDEYLLNMSPAASKVGSPSPNPKLLYIAASDDDGDDFHVRTPILDAEKKVGSPMKKSTSGEKAVHLIPVVLILCALILWLFSKPVSP